MTLRETELIGKKLVKYGFYRSSTGRHIYTLTDSGMNISVVFKLYFSTVWVVEFTHEIAYHTRVKFIEHAVVFTPEWVIEEHKKLQAMFKFLRS
jgi:hypothetical protein